MHGTVKHMIANVNSMETQLKSISGQLLKVWRPYSEYNSMVIEDILR